MNKQIDIGKYNKNEEEFYKIVHEMYLKYPNGITLPPEYAHYVNENMLRFFIQLARYKFVSKIIKPTDKILEIGCGSGLGSVYLSQYCTQVTGIDVKSTAIEEAKYLSTRKNVEFFIQDFFQFDTSIQYDVIVCLDVIEHMPMEQGNILLAKIAKHLTSTGMLILGSPSIYSYNYQSPISKASHVKCYDQQELLSLLDEHFCRTVPFSMNDEIVHTGHPKMAWYYFMLGLMPKTHS